MKTTMESMVVEFDLIEKSHRQISWDDFYKNHPIEQTKKEKIYWVHCNPKEAQHFETLIRNLHLPTESLDMSQKNVAVPKIFDTDRSLTVRIPCLRYTELKRRQVIKVDHILIHLTNSYCLTIAEVANTVLGSFASNCAKIIPYANTPCSIFFILLDNILNDYSIVLYHFELMSERYDFRTQPMNSNVYGGVVYAKKQVVKMKRYIVIIRNILMRISGRKIPVISEQCRLSLVSLYEHCVMAVAEVDALRESLNGFLAQIDNTLMYQMNKSIKVLTAFAAIFLPLTLITGIYGMNFHKMPELSWKYGYVWAIFLMLAVAALLIYTFKKKKLF